MSPARLRVTRGGKPCPLCYGTGVVPDPVAIGQEMRQIRQAAGLSLRELGARLNVTASYLCDLELGRRHWSRARMSRYRAALADEARTR